MGITDVYTRTPALHIYHTDTLSNLHTVMCDSLAYGPAANMDMITSVDVQKHNVIAHAESMEWDFQLKDLWLTKSRWTTMIRQYINPIALETWLNSCEAKLRGRKRGVSVMRTNEVQQQHSPTRSGTTRTWRTWGSCMLAIGYRALPQPQITLHSRTSYLGYIAALDLSVAQVCASMVAERVGLQPEDISFTWHLEAAQFHAFKSLAFLLNHEDRREEFLAIDLDSEDPGKLKRRTPGLYISRKWMDEFERNDRDGQLYGDMNFGQTRRIRKRYHTEVLGYEYGAQFEGGGHASNSQNKRFKPLPPNPASELTFDNLFTSAAKRSKRVNWDEDNVNKVDTTDEKSDDALAD